MRFLVTNYSCYSTPWWSRAEMVTVNFEKHSYSLLLGCSKYSNISVNQHRRIVTRTSIAIVYVSRSVLYAGNIIMQHYTKRDRERTQTNLFHSVYCTTKINLKQSLILDSEIAPFAKHTSQSDFNQFVL